ncbi:MAG TPA: inositol monophosphatase family protein [Vicinamibacterales bacterium]|jgi:myo-inositol-1(or 4)-monophosphatase|nr:inositol monophosphatase family protein [Vicinamibacterales bacterium]|tara:strand:- start:352 stop:1299 length:948 start_codon:yes stop_codon:yes gene_type:complete
MPEESDAGSQKSETGLRASPGSPTVTPGSTSTPTRHPESTPGSPPGSHPPAWQATAIDIVLRAGEIQLRHLGGDLQIDMKGPIDLVTKVDLEVERMCRNTIAERFPGHAVLAEEFANEADEATARHRWVFDPIDGTVNYAHGLPLFCSCLALEVDGRPEVAAVFDPTRRELFTAERGVGAWLNGAPIRVSGATSLLNAMLCTGFAYDVHETVDDVVGLFGAFVARARAVRRLGSAALDLCYVAAGRFDGFWERGLQPWDVSAATLVIEEAGGRVSRLDGTAFDTRCGEIVASNGHLQAEMIDVISSHGRAPNRTT